MQLQFDSEDGFIVGLWQALVISFSIIADNASISTVMLFYDIMLTFADEVELIWSQRFSLVTVLWHIVRFFHLLIRNLH